MGNKQSTTKPKREVNNHKLRPTYLGKNQQHLYSLIHEMNNIDIRKLLLLNIIEQTIDEYDSNKLITILSKQNLSNTFTNKDFNKLIKTFNIFNNIKQAYHIIFPFDICTIIIEYSNTLYLNIQKYGISINNNDGYYDNLILKTQQLTIEMKLRHIKLLISGNPIIFGLRNTRFGREPIFSIHLRRDTFQIDLWNGCNGSVLTVKHNILKRNNKEWVHFVCVIDNFTNVNYVYVNGMKYEFLSKYRFDPRDNAKKQNINIGGYMLQKDNLDENMSCDIKEIRFWNIVRNAREIKKDKDVTLNGNEHGLIGYWLYGSDCKKSLTNDRREMVFSHSSFEIDCQ